MASMAKPMVTVEETLTLSNGKSPVRINQSPSKSIPRFLPAKLFVSAMWSPFSKKDADPSRAGENYFVVLEVKAMSRAITLRAVGGSTASASRGTFD
jgi:hypothetical protein